MGEIMKTQKILPILIAMSSCAAECFASEYTRRAATNILIEMTMMEMGTALCVIAYLAVNVLVIKWFGLFGLCLVIVFNIYLLPAVLFLNSN